MRLQRPVKKSIVDEMRFAASELVSSAVGFRQPILLPKMTEKEAVDKANIHISSCA